MSYLKKLPKLTTKTLYDDLKRFSLCVEMCEYHEVPQEENYPKKIVSRIRSELQRRAKENKGPRLEKYEITAI